MVALPGGTGQVLEQRDSWSHAKHLPWGLWESVLQQGAQQEGSDRGRWAGRAAVRDPTEGQEHWLKL